MVVQLYGFDWEFYEGHVMPAFARWLIDEDESGVYRLFEQTQCAREEQFLPDPMHRLRVWPRAEAFVKTLPRGPYSRREYTKLCSAEHFTALSDRYMYRHAPQLYQNSDALRSVWGAIIEEYCLPWCSLSTGEESGVMEEEVEQGYTGPAAQSEHILRSELVTLLHSAGLGELAKELGEQGTQVERFDWQLADEKKYLDAFPRVEHQQQFLKGENKPGPGSLDAEVDALEDAGNSEEKPSGIIIGYHPNTLHLRGWLARNSIRAMALFEYLACGRRAMPFGYEANEPYGAYAGYLIPDEVWQLATCLRDITPPTQGEAEEDYLSFRHQLSGTPGTFRLVDEVLPAYSAEFLTAVRGAAMQGLGLICSVG